MSMTPPPARRVLSVEGLDALLTALRERGYRVVGPTRREGALLWDELEAAEDLPRGWRDEHAPGRVRLRPRDDRAFFGFNLGPDGPKRFLHPPRQSLFRARREGQGFAVEPPPPPPKVALIGARACELAAVAVQDRVFQEGGDSHYASRREQVFVVAVQCAQAAATCFCPSMGTGPRLDGHFDLGLTEVLQGEQRFVVEVGSPAGAELLETLETRPAEGTEQEAPEAAAAAATQEITASLPTEGLRERLLDALESPHWDAVAQRCLGCANCTMVCPTCFCTTVSDTTDLAGVAERTRSWDSCFNLEYSYVHGAGPVRGSLGARYRQWLTHKLATWWDQFGTSGCVGCGRCVSWCPAGIDIVAEAKAATEDA